VKPASPGTIRGGTSEDPTGRNHVHHGCRPGRGVLELTKDAARPGNALRDLRISAWARTSAPAC